VQPPECRGDGGGGGKDDVIRAELIQSEGLIALEGDGFVFLIAL
jgi:hypothetical protein